MTIDVDELRERIQSVRQGVTSEGHPRGAAKYKPVRVARQAKTRGFSLNLQRIYAIPFLGYVVRIITAIAVFPRILANFRAFQASHLADSVRFHQTADDLRIQVKHLESQLKDIQRDAHGLRQAVAALQDKLADEQVGHADSGDATSVGKGVIR